MNITQIINIAINALSALLSAILRANLEEMAWPLMRFTETKKNIIIKLGMPMSNSNFKRLRIAKSVNMQGMV